uniref:Choline transporter-like protein n=1 Tax=Strombidium inclinatum TaxID=197538 RepID=A0A7S3ISV9_9SPIT|mmetsp:Transcript_37711/g.57748  ORF Transcript_37711/g.57748 Transcript_37711/m.57748 type:complete len:582 (+) Transcript_37711:2016-3761(+)
MVGTSGYGVLYGDPELLLTPWDADGNGCGYNKTTKDYPYLYFPSINLTAAQEANENMDLTSVTDILRFSMCVKECPTDNVDEVVQCRPPTFALDSATYQECVFYIGGTQYGKPLRYPTTKFANRFCVPDVGAAIEGNSSIVVEFKAQFDEYIGGSGIQTYISDIVACKDPLLISFGTAFLLGFIYMIVLRIAGGPIIYLSIVGLILGTAYGGYMLYETSLDMPVEDQYKKYYEIGSYVVWGIAGVLLCCTCFNLKNIRIGVAVMKCTAAFIGGTPQVFLAPPLAAIMIVAWFIIWAAIATFIFSVGKIMPNPDLPFLTTVEWTDETRYVFLYSLFGYLWLNAFMIGVTQFIISAACAIWYFSCTSDSNGSGSLCTGLWWVFRYHLGSIAFGAFLIALVQLIRIIFEYYKRQIMKANKDNQIVKIILWTTSYLLSCLERFVKFISKNAYIQIALTGKNFCAAAWNAFVLILTNALRFGTANSIGFIFNVLGVLFITSANGVVVYAALHYYDPFVGLATNWITPCVIGGLQGFLIGMMFMSVFSFASDTILQSFLVDEQLKRPDGMRPAIMNQFIEGIEDKKE